MSALAPERDADSEQTAPQVLWYINPTDGDVPWEPSHRVPPTFDVIRHQARTLDRLGYYGALTTAREAISLVADTQNLRFLIPEYPGVKPPVLLAEEAQVFDQYSGGRLIYNQVNGADPVLHRYGRFGSKAERYRVSAEYWTQVKRLYLDDVEPFDGEFFSYGPRYKPPIPGPRQPGGIEVWGTGASSEGIAHAAEVLDVYLSFMSEPAALTGLFDRVRLAAAERGRTLRFGVLASVIVRETDDEAWERFEWQLGRTRPETVLATADRNLRSFGYPGLDEIRSDNPQVQGRIEALRAGRLPGRADLEFAPNMAAGLTTWTAAEPPFDIAGKGTGTYFVGSAENVAAAMSAVARRAGIDVWILSGWPLAAEAEIAADLLLPLLLRQAPARAVGVTR
ncbi:LLM class flavin-dependent oxidoreductase [Gordonia sp. ABSL11-1]|uniref:LLM class flavin-dependent oxidoreductase n=1 Tax=Gordonia sp. ABSL11-1 TaxID=3053924 RepID=UPI0025734620|nr:LLM class flavin-dependent oxidoreductase [Gordonia sp. ABSL11-1]MDL9945563.1 LLM class flavin-dependent oxidoreductase [Gordonia sp. ABSL11-1]